MPAQADTSCLRSLCSGKVGTATNFSNASPFRYNLELPRTRAWNLRLRRPTPYPLLGGGAEKKWGASRKYEKTDTGSGTCVYSLLFVLLNQHIITAFGSSHTQSIGASVRFFQYALHASAFALSCEPISYFSLG